MGLSHTLVGTLFLALVIVNCSGAADIEVNKDSIFMLFLSAFSFFLFSCSIVC